MTIDCHVNIWKPEHFTPLYGAQMSRVRSDSGEGLKCDARTVAAEMTGVDRAIVFSPRYGDSAGVEGDDETVAEAVALFPDLFIGFAYADPRRADCMDDLRHSIETLGLKGVKYGPIYNRVALSDPRMAPVFAYCQANDLPLTLHMGTTFAENADADLGRPIHVDAVAARYPDLKMIMAHMGHPWFGECIAVARKRRNVYCDLSALFYRPWQFWNILMSCQEYSVQDKLFFGTDFPFSRVEESLNGLRTVNAVVEGTSFPRVSGETIDMIIQSNPLQHWWHQPPT